MLLLLLLLLVTWQTGKPLKQAAARTSTPAHPEPHLLQLMCFNTSAQCSATRRPAAGHGAGQGAVAG
jgi:hypothetical protein